MNLLDAMVGAYVAYGSARGRRRGLADEAYRLLRVGLALAAGSGLYALVSDALGRVLSLQDHVSGPVAFLGTALGSWSLLRAARTRFMAWAQRRWVHAAGWGGAIIGGLRCLIMALGAMFTAQLAGRPGLISGSWVGRVVELVFGN